MSKNQEQSAKSNADYVDALDGKSMTPPPIQFSKDGEIDDSIMSLGFLDGILGIDVGKVKGKNNENGTEAEATAVKGKVNWSQLFGLDKTIILEGETDIGKVSAADYDDKDGGNHGAGVNLIDSKWTVGTKDKDKDTDSVISINGGFGKGGGAKYFSTDDDKDGNKEYGLEIPAGPVGLSAKSEDPVAAVLGPITAIVKIIKPDTNLTEEVADKIPDEVKEGATDMAEKAEETKKAIDETLKDYPIIDAAADTAIETIEDMVIPGGGIFEKGNDLYNAWNDL